MLANGQRVDELVGDEQQRPRRKVANDFMPIGVGRGLGLRLPQHRAGLDEVHLAAKACSAHQP